MPIPVALAGLASIGATTGGATAATVGATSAMTSAGAGGLAAGAGGTAAMGSTLTPAINSAASGGGLSGAGGLMGGGMAPGYTPSLTYSAATGNPVAGSVPLQSMKPLGLMGQQPSGLSALLNDPRLREYAQKAMQSMGGGMSNAFGKPINPPQVQRGAPMPFNPFQFDIRNYQFRRPGGY